MGGFERDNDPPPWERAKQEAELQERLAGRSPPPRSAEDDDERVGEVTDPSSPKSVHGTSLVVNGSVKGTTLK